MGLAPEVGIGKVTEAVEQAKQVMTMTIKGETRTLAVNNVPFKERAIVRKATGLPLEAYLASEDQIGLDSIMVLWWLAGRASGNVFLTIDQVEAAWPTDLAPSDIGVTVDDPSGDDPEA